MVSLSLSIPYRRTIANLSGGSAIALRADPGAVLYGAVTLRARVGPEFSLASSGSSSQTAFPTLIGLACNAR